MSPPVYSPEMPASDREINIVRMVARDLVLALQSQRPLQLPPFNYIGVASFRVREEFNNARMFLFRLQLSPTNEDWGALVRLENGQLPVLLRVFGPLQFQPLEEPPPFNPQGVPLGPEGQPGFQGGFPPQDGGFQGPNPGQMAPIPGQLPMDQGGLVAPQQPGLVLPNGPMKRDNANQQSNNQQGTSKRETFTGNNNSNSGQQRGRGF